MKQTTNVSSGYLCHCLSITSKRFDEMMEEMPHPTFASLKKEHGIGSLCSSCEYEAKGVLQEYLLLHPEKTSGGVSDHGLRADLSYAWHELKRRVHQVSRTITGRSATPAAKSYHTGIFFMRHDGLESHLVVSNLAFPEHSSNVNGPAATFRATLYGESGQILAESDPVSVPDGTSLELSPEALFPKVKDDFVGGLYVEYDALMQAGSLRPYGVLVNTTTDFRARCHYHDKFALFRDPGFFQNSSPFEPGQNCWMAIANCQPQAYESDAYLKIGGKKLEAHLSLGPMAARWVSLAELFPDAIKATPEQRSPSLLWLENPQHVMVYFYWFNEAVRTWTGQHH